MIERYRSDYEGEFVIVETKWANGKKEQVREWVANPIINQHISGRAACITGGTENFDYTRLQQHRGGLLGSKKMQTYGTGRVTQIMNLNFAVEVDPILLDEILGRKYQENHIVYTTAKRCIEHPGEFYLIPYNPVVAIEAALLYLAAFDGHKEIFMIGYNKDTSAGNSAWQQHVKNVIQSYRSVKFYMIGSETSMPESWVEQPNTTCINLQEFISYCDI